MTNFMHSSITDDKAGRSVTRISQDICELLNNFEKNGHLDVHYSQVLIRPICIPRELGDIDNDIKLLRKRNIELFFNIPYLEWMESDETHRRLILIEHLIKLIVNYEGSKKKLENIEKLLSVFNQLAKSLSPQT